MSIELDEHREYLADAPRVEAFARAISAAVRPGDIVVDLGCGTGILGLLACRAGAARVYAIEAGGMAEVAEAIAGANGLRERIVIVRGHSLAANLPERADVVVGDLVGRFGIEAGCVEYYEDARRRFLRPDGRLVPRSVSLWVAPLEQAATCEDATFWSTRPFGFDMAPAQSIAWNSGYPRRVDASDLLAPGARVATLTLGEPYDHFVGTATFRVARPGTLHGVAGWFVADLGGAVSMTNAPGHPSRIRRRNVVLPTVPVAVSPGDVVRVELIVRPVDVTVKWIVDHVPVSGGASPRHFEHSTFNGMLLAADLLRRTHPDFVPTLTERGRARHLVLERADGRTALRDIERELLDRHPMLFRTAADASSFVAEVVTRYAE